MPDDRYSLAELARLAGVTPRTVRYYVARGLLPSPEAAGPATRYGEAHLARLNLIRHLQRDHLPLAEIRARLEGLADAEVVATVSALEARAPEPSQGAGDTLAFVRSLMDRSGVRPTVRDAHAAGVRLSRLAVADALETYAASVPAAVVPAEVAPAPAPLAAPAPAAAAASSPVPARGIPARSTWERLVLSPDVELHVRRPLDRATNRRVDRLERIARELFDHD